MPNYTKSVTAVLDLLGANEKHGPSNAIRVLLIFRRPEHSTIKTTLNLPLTKIISIRTPDIKLPSNEDGSKNKDFLI